MRRGRFGLAVSEHKGLSMMGSLVRILAPLVIACGAFLLNAEAVYADKAQSLEAPELARPGQYLVGTVIRELKLPARVQLTAAGTQSVPRILSVRMWYPSADRKGDNATYRHMMKLPDKSAHEIVEHGTAFQDAAIAKGDFPLVVMSHGYSGWSEQLSRLGEHLASRGYMVAAIDHRDTSFDSLPGFLMSFGNVLINRSLDQQQVLDTLLDPNFAKTETLLASVDKTKVALIGYSMGGYGALGTAGAAYDPVGTPFAQLPPAAKSTMFSTDKRSSERVKALVLIAPWGGQPDSRAWPKESLATLKTPTLVIAGDHDDIVNFSQGVRWLFDTMTASDRYLLIYHEARHNVAGNAVDPGSVLSAGAIGYTQEPVWRQTRINQINQHFVTAFLDATLKKDSTKRKYLDVPTPVASDGKWPSAFGTIDGGAVAGDGQPAYWRGFQRRWATGLELHHKRHGQ